MAASGAHPPTHLANTIIHLNVGGTRFTTTASTLLSCPTGKLAGLVDSRSGTPFVSNSEGEYFIDRDPSNFRYVLNYLRDGSLPVLTTPTQRRELLTEARFYQINDLAEWCGTEDGLDSAMKHQQQIVLQQYATTIKNHSMQRFREGVQCYDVIVQCALKTIHQHAVSRDDPWLTLPLADLFNSEPLAEHRKFVFDAGKAIVVLRCLCDSLRVLGFAAECRYEDVSVRIDLWSPLDESSHDFSTKLAMNLHLQGAMKWPMFVQQQNQQQPSQQPSQQQLAPQQQQQQQLQRPPELWQLSPQQKPPDELNDFDPWTFKG